MTEKVNQALEPSAAEKTDYFRRFGIRVRDMLRALKAFDVFGEGAKNTEKKKQWFIGYRAVVEGVMALKIAELVDLPEDEARLLLEAAMTHHATKRRQYEEQKTGRPITPDVYDEIQKSGWGELESLGVDPRALEIGLASGSNFKIKADKGEIRPQNDEEKKDFQASALHGIRRKLHRAARRFQESHAIRGYHRLEKTPRKRTGAVSRPFG